MATIKSYTDLEQSRKLAEILPLESADMYIDSTNPYYIHTELKHIEHFDSEHYPCWSLAALLEVLHESKICHYNNRYYCQYMSEGDEFPIYSTTEYDNSVDACYEMIIHLHELNLL